MKNIFSQTQKGVSPQGIKKKYTIGFLVILFFILTLLIGFYLKGISLRYFILFFGILIGAQIFYGGYLGIKYKMVGNWVSFPRMSGKVAVIFGWIYCVLGLAFIIVSYRMFLTLGKYVY
jgi:hypothetical protein